MGVAVPGDRKRRSVAAAIDRRRDLVDGLLARSEKSRKVGVRFDQYGAATLFRCCNKVALQIKIEFTTFVLS